jgi:hypothetical protein
MCTLVGLVTRQFCRRVADVEWMVEIFLALSNQKIKEKGEKDLR